MASQDGMQGEGREDGCGEDGQDRVLETQGEVEAVSALGADDRAEAVVGGGFAGSGRHGCGCSGSEGGGKGKRCARMGAARNSIRVSGSPAQCGMVITDRAG